MPQQARDKSASTAGCRGGRQRRQTPDSRLVSLHTKLRGMHAPNGFNATSKSATKPTQCIPPRLHQSQTSSATASHVSVKSRLKQGSDPAKRSMAGLVCCGILYVPKICHSDHPNAVRSAAQHFNMSMMFPNHPHAHESMN